MTTRTQWLNGPDETDRRAAEAIARCTGCTVEEAAAEIQRGKDELPRPRVAGGETNR
jgi:hypothetical protein